MYAEEFNSTNIPHYFNTSANLNTYYPTGGNGTSKVTTLEIASGREGIISVDSTSFYFMLGDISLDSQPISFVSISDTVSVNSKPLINQYLLSNPIQVNNNSEFTYGVQYGASDSSIAAYILGEDGFVNFKVSLIDDNTSEVLGTFDNVTFTSDSVSDYEDLSYRINTSGIGNRTVRLKLTIEDNLNASYSLTDALADESVLEKSTRKVVDYNNGVEKITTYALSQNYPNPFNPTTTINYQLPQNGYVTLKVYDILGKEVSTLVNEQKNQGRYSVNFDGSKLASGVYVYQIRVNDYISSKKMLMIK